MSETLEDKTVQKTIAGLEKQLQAINYHFENAKKELEDLKLLLGNKQKSVKRDINPNLHKHIKCELVPRECGCE